MSYIYLYTYMYLTISYLANMPSIRVHSTCTCTSVTDRTGIHVAWECQFSEEYGPEHGLGILPSASGVC